MARDCISAALHKQLALSYLQGEPEPASSEILCVCTKELPGPSADPPPSARHAPKARPLG